MKPFSQACLNNREPILDVLRRVFANSRRVLEIGSGTGQHAVYFAEQLPHLHWQTSDLAENHAGINAWLDEFCGDNLSRPLKLDVTSGIWPCEKVDAIFSANTAHIMSWEAVQQMFAGIPEVLDSGGVMALYGPFNYHGAYTSDSNQRFDVWLKTQGLHRGIRDFEQVDGLAHQAGMTLMEDNAMPANNRLLVWRMS